MLPGQMLPGQMSPWQLESVLDVPRTYVQSLVKIVLSSAVLVVVLTVTGVKQSQLQVFRLKTEVWQLDKMKMSQLSRT